MTPWLAIVGIGEDGLAGLAPAARALVDGAGVLVGGERHLAMVPEDGRERLIWPSPLSALVDEIARRRGQRVCVLATGDPMHYGIGVTLARRVPIEEMTIVPAPSAFSLACARLGWSLGEVETLTLHGRPVELLHPAVQPGARLLLLSHDAATPARVAELLCARGYGDTRITVLERMGGPAERRLTGTAAAWAADDVDDFNTVAVECVAGPQAAFLPRAPGLPDEAFRHDGQITKREVRALTLAALVPVPGQLLWDVGAGCGSVAIEWLRSHPFARAAAVERREDRVALIADNAAALGAPDLEIVTGAAPAALDGLEPPDAVFVGGGLSGANLLAACWRALKPGGRLVANAVTLEGEQALSRWRAEAGGELVRLAVSRAEPVGRYTGWRPLMPVTQLRAVKR
ncbi:MAG: precorrin-6y C5,15-methyltransferase (decarboxylating) subunit CbiE [Kiloniellaceae bacterium]